MRHVLNVALTLALMIGVGAAHAQVVTSATSSRCATPAELTALETTAKQSGVTVTNLTDLGQAYLCLKRAKDARNTLEAAVALDYAYFDAHFF